jgi:hypothetical protein
MKNGFRAVFVVSAILLAGGMLVATGCSSGPEVKAQAYAKLKDTRTFEYDFPTVWKGIEATFRNYKVTDRDPDEVSVNEMRKLTRRKLQTDWIYAESRDKYVEYKINDSPRKKYLQTRVKYTVYSNSVMGGTEVRVRTEEEIERLKDDGTPAGYDAVKEQDTSRPNEILDKIGQALLSAAP